MIGELWKNWRSVAKGSGFSKNACILRNSQTTENLKLHITKQDALLLRPRK